MFSFVPSKIIIIIIIAECRCWSHRLFVCTVCVSVFMDRKKNLERGDGNRLRDGCMKSEKNTVLFQKREAIKSRTAKSSRREVWRSEERILSYQLQYAFEWKERIGNRNGIFAAAAGKRKKKRKSGPSSYFRTSEVLKCVCCWGMCVCVSSIHRNRYFLLSSSSSCLVLLSFHLISHPLSSRV